MKNILLVIFSFTQMAMAQDQCANITTLLNEVQSRQFAADNNALENAQRTYNEALADFELASMMYLLKETVESSYESLRRIDPSNLSLARSSVDTFENNATTAIDVYNYFAPGTTTNRLPENESSRAYIERMILAFENAEDQEAALHRIENLKIGDQSIAEFFASTEALRNAIKANPANINAIIRELKNAPTIPGEIDHPLLTVLRDNLEALNKKATGAITSSLKNHLVKLKKQLSASPEATRPMDFVTKIDTAMLCFDEEKTYNILNHCLEEALPGYNEITPEVLQNKKIFAQAKFRELASAMNNSDVQNLEQIKIKLLGQYREAGCVASMESSFNTGIAACSESRFFGFASDPVSDLLIGGSHILRFNNRQENNEHLANSFISLGRSCNGDSSAFCSYISSNGMNIPAIQSGDASDASSSGSASTSASSSTADNETVVREPTRREERIRNRNIRRENRHAYTEEHRRSDFFADATDSNGHFGTGFTYGIASWLTIPTTAIAARAQTDDTINYLNNYLYPSYTREQDAIAYNNRLINDMEFRMAHHPPRYSDVNWFGTNTSSTNQIIDFNFSVPELHL